jgi:hypothetical protein
MEECGGATFVSVVVRCASAHATVYCGFSQQISKSSFFEGFNSFSWYYPRWVICSSSSFSALAKACCARVCFEST